MEQLQFEKRINASANLVFDKMLSKDTYEQWTYHFNPGSTFEGTWEKGSKIYFIGPQDDGKKEGMVGMIAENIPGKLLTISHLGFLSGDQEITSGESVDSWSGAIEEYSFEEKDGVTTLKVRVDVTDDHKDYFAKVWPLALDELKSICES